MICRDNCGACCIAPSINKPFFGMPNGKPAGMSCVHLSESYACNIFESPERPLVCAGFMAEKDICGDRREQALIIISDLELITLANK